MVFFLQMFYALIDMTGVCFSSNFPCVSMVKFHFLGHFFFSFKMVVLIYEDAIKSLKLHHVEHVNVVILQERRKFFFFFTICIFYFISFFLWLSYAGFHNQFSHLNFVNCCFNTCITAQFFFVSDLFVCIFSPPFSSPLTKQKHVFLRNINLRVY